METALSAHRRGGISTTLGVAVAYFLAARFGLSLAFTTQQVTAVWPPTGIAVAALLLWGNRAVPAIFAGAFFANAVASEPVLTAAGIALGNTLGPLAGVASMRRIAPLGGAPSTTRHAFFFVVCCALLGMSVSASNGVCQLLLAGIIPWSAAKATWWTWWVGDAMGVLLVTPVLLSWLGPRRLELTRLRLAELGALLGLLLLVSANVFSAGVLIDTHSDYHLQYAVFPFIIWAALRFSQRETATAVLLVSGVAIWATLHGRGPFGAGAFDQDKRLILLQAFMATVALTGLALSAATAERAQAQALLHRVNDELERRVAARTAELEASNVELAKKSEEVEAFVYTVSHDLRAPLVNLQGFSKELRLSCNELQTVLQGAGLEGDTAAVAKRLMDEDVAGALRYITASATKFQQLTDALLALSRYGRQDFKRELVDVNQVLRGTMDSLHTAIERSQASITVQLMPQAWADTTALGQIFANLIDNALKYLDPARPGEIRVEGQLQDGVASFTVRDNGSGIPPSAKRRLFQVFQRFHPQLAQGDGMGLAIVKRAVERHGGKIWVESEVGVGSAFHFTLPKPAGPIEP